MHLVTDSFYSPVSNKHVNLKMIFTYNKHMKNKPEIGIHCTQIIPWGAHITHKNIILLVEPLCGPLAKRNIERLINTTFYLFGN